MPLFGLLIYGSSLAVSKSFSNSRSFSLARLMATEPFRKLGDFSLQLYLWRWPLFAVMHWQLELPTGEKLCKGWVALAWWPNFGVPLVVLYAASYAWYIYVDNPWRAWLTKKTTTTTTPIVAEVLPPAAVPPQSKSGLFVCKWVGQSMGSCAVESECAIFKDTVMIMILFN